MDLHRTLHNMHRLGVNLQAKEGRLAVRSRSPLTDTQRAFIRAHKAELLRLVSTPPPPPDLIETDREAIREALKERAAIREHEGGETKQQAEKAALSAMRVYRYRLADNPASWLTMICPGCDLEEARRTLHRTFGKERLLAVVQYHNKRAEH